MKAVFKIIFLSLMAMSAFAQDEELPQPQDQKVRDTTAREVRISWGSSA